MMVLKDIVKSLLCLTAIYIPPLIRHSIAGSHTTSVAQIPLRTLHKTLRGYMTEKIQCSLYGETMAVHCNSNVKCSVMLSNILMAFLRTVTTLTVLLLCCYTYSLLTHPQLSQEPKSIWYEWTDCMTKCWVHHRVVHTHTTHLLTLATVLQSLGSHPTENTAIVLI